MDAVAQVQRSFRNPASEKDPEVAKRFIRTYEADDAVDRSSLAATMWEWFARDHPISNDEFLHRLKEFRLIAPVSVLQSKSARKAAWRINMRSDRSSPARATNAATEAILWQKTARELTLTELQQVQRMARGQHADAALPSFVKETGSVATAALLSTLAAKTPRAHLSPSWTAPWRSPRAHLRPASSR